MSDESREFEAFLGQPSLADASRAKRAAEDAKRSLAAALAELALAERRLEIALAIKDPSSPPKIQRRSKKAAQNEATAVMLASDWHVEEVVDPKTVNGRNRYNPEIARARSTRFFQNSTRLIEHARAGASISDAVLWLGGDLITGYIHEELVETNAMSPTEAILFCQELLIVGIDYLLAHANLERLVIPCSYGNHGRTTERRRVSSGAKNSFEWLMYHSLARHYAAEKRVEFVIADGSHLYVEVYDQTLRFTHGDDVRYQGGVGGLGIPLRKACDSWDHFRGAGLTCIGHWHELRDHGFCVANGSLIGFNAYALSIKARFEPPRQAFFLLDAERGKTLVAPIWVDDG